MGVESDLVLEPAATRCEECHRAVDEFFGLLRDLMLLVVMLLVGLSGYWLVQALTG